MNRNRYSQSSEVLYPPSLSLPLPSSSLLLLFFLCLLMLFLVPSDGSSMASLWSPWSCWSCSSTATMLSSYMQLLGIRMWFCFVSFLPSFITSLLAMNTVFSLLPLFITGLLEINTIFALFSLYFLLVILLMIISRLVLSLGVIVHIITLKGFTGHPLLPTSLTMTIDCLQHLLLIILLLRFHHSLDLFLQLLVHA